MSSAVSTLDIKYDEISSELGSGGSVRDVRGIVHFSLPASENELRSEGGLCIAISSSCGFSSTISLSGNGGLSSGRELVKRINISLQIALIASSSTTALHRVFSPRLFAIISSSSSVYCTHCNVVAVRLYVGLREQ